MANEIETTFRGRLGADAVVKAAGAKEVAELRVAVAVRKKDASGAWVDVRTDWVSVSVWDHLIGAVVQLKRGQLVEVSGRLHAGAYLSKDGEAKVDLRVSASKVTIVPLPPKADAVSEPPVEQWAAAVPDGAPF